LQLPADPVPNAQEEPSAGEKIVLAAQSQLLGLHSVAWLPGRFVQTVQRCVGVSGPNRFHGAGRAAGLSG
jgi:hypothetical protein